jgi:hypothetical protein
MASADLQVLLRRVQTDGDLLERLLLDPQEALDEFQLTSEERDALVARDTSVFRLLVASDDEDEDGRDERETLEAFPEISLPQLNPPTLPGGGGFSLHLPPLTLTLGPPPAPPSPPDPPPLPHVPPLPPLPDPPPNPFPHIPPTPDPPPPLPDPPPDFPPTPPMHPDPPPIPTITFRFLVDEMDPATVPQTILAEVQDSTGEPRREAISRLLAVIDGRQEP